MIDLSTKSSPNKSLYQLPIFSATSNLPFKIACGMSLISMVSMELAMNLTDYLIVGSAKLVWWVVPIMLIVGFLTPWPYNYWRLKKYGVNCH